MELLYASSSGGDLSSESPTMGDLCGPLPAEGRQYTPGLTSDCKQVVSQSALPAKTSGMWVSPGNCSLDEQFIYFTLTLRCFALCFVWKCRSATNSDRRLPECSPLTWRKSQEKGADTLPSLLLTRSPPHGAAESAAKVKLWVPRVHYVIKKTAACTFERCLK